MLRTIHINFNYQFSSISLKYAKHKLKITVYGSLVCLRPEVLIYRGGYGSSPEVL